MLTLLRTLVAELAGIHYELQRANDIKIVELRYSGIPIDPAEISPPEEHR